MNPSFQEEQNSLFIASTNTQFYRKEAESVAFPCLQRCCYSFFTMCSFWKPSNEHMYTTNTFLKEIMSMDYCCSLCIVCFHTGPFQRLIQYEAAPLQKRFYQVTSLTKMQVIFSFWQHPHVSTKNQWKSNNRQLTCHGRYLRTKYRKITLLRVYQAVQAELTF